MADIEAFKIHLLQALIKANAGSLSRFEFMKLINKITVSYCKTITNQSDLEKTAINNCMKAFLSKLIHNETKTPQNMIDELKAELNITDVSNIKTTSEMQVGLNPKLPLSVRFEHIYQHNNLKQLELLLQSEKIEFDVLMTQLLNAYKKERYDIIDIILQKGMTQEQQQKASTGILTFALFDGNEAVAYDMLDYGADINTMHKNNTLLNTAVWLSEPQMIIVLLDMGADVMKADDIFPTTLHAVAGKYKDNKELPTEDLIKLLLSKGVDINLKAGKEGRTPLMSAIQGNQYETVKTLIEMGADVNCRDNNGFSPLYYSVRNWCQHPDMISELVKAGCDVNETYELGPLIFYTVEFLNKDSLNSLLKNGARVDVKNSSGETLLEFAQEWKRSIDPYEYGLQAQLSGIISTLKTYEPSLIQKACLMTHRITQKWLGRTR